MRPALVAAALMMVCGTALAETRLPKIDVTGACRYRIRYLSLGPVRECLRVELRSQDLLQWRWPGLSETERRLIVHFGRQQHVRSYIPFATYLAVLDQQRTIQRDIELDHAPLALEY